MRLAKKISLFFKALFFSVLTIAIICALLYFLVLNGKDSSENSFKLKDDNLLSKIIDTKDSPFNFVILGTDKSGSRTDTIIVGRFDPEDSSVALVSVPRDTMVTMPEDRVLLLSKQKNATVPKSGVMKLNEVHHHSGEKYAIEFTVKQIEELLGIKTDYYIEVNLDAFRYFVDAVGGVSFDVPKKMYYNDPTQNLKINLKPGLQTLDGEAAEGLVRFRYGYARGDIDRMETQQKFIKALISQALAKENIAKNLPKIVATGFKYVKTNISIADLPRFERYYKGFSADNISTYTLPSSSKKRGAKSYQTLDETAKDEIIKEVFFSDKTSDDVQGMSSKDLKIQVLNGAAITGLARTTSEKLEKDGFKIANIGDYKGTKKDATRIMVRKDGYGEDLKKYFSEPQVVVDENISADYDVVIIIGLSENSEE